MKKLIEVFTLPVGVLPVTEIEAFIDCNLLECKTLAMMPVDLYNADTTDFPLSTDLLFNEYCALLNLSESTGVVIWNEVPSEYTGEELAEFFAKSESDHVVVCNYLTGERIQCLY